MKFLLLSVFSVFAFSSFQQATDPAQAAHDQVEAMGKALINKDYQAYIRYTDPRVVQEMGGEKAFADTLKSYEAQWKHYNMTMSGIIAGKASAFIDTAGELQCTIPVTTEMKVQGGKVTIITTFIAISKDQGKTWMFMDTEEEYKDIRKKYTDLSSQLQVPPPAKPTFTAD